MATSSTRRGFLKKSVAAAAAASVVTSLEEYTLLAQEAEPAAAPAPAAPKGPFPSGTIGKVKMSRIICGGNLISGFAHSRDLIYVSELLKAYFTEEKIMQTWALCEEHGIDTMIGIPGDKKATDAYRKYRTRGGKIQCIGQLAPPKSGIARAAKEAADAGMVGAVLVGNEGDAWTREDAVDKIEEFVTAVKAQGLIAGVGGHELRTPLVVDAAGIKPDFYMKTLHSTNYWSTRRPDQHKEVIDNGGADNYWCADPEATIKAMQEMSRPWMAYKVLAAGAIHPREGFKHAFENGADFCVVGMFDFQVAEDAAVARTVLAAKQKRKRPWRA
jgi:hypothetical protein